MPAVTYIEFDGTSHVTDVPIGENVMRAALHNNVPGIVGEAVAQMAAQRIIRGS